MSNNTTEPRELQPGAIPLELRKTPQWVCWQYEERGGKKTKVPCQPNGRAAKCNDAGTWSSFKKSVAAYEAGDFDGVGFVFSADDEFCGIDLDRCKSPARRRIAMRIVRQLDSYTETSPSGTGIHVIAKGKLPPGRRRKGPVEMYDGGRFFCITGWHIPGTPAETRKRSRALAELHCKTFFEGKPEAANADEASDEAANGSEANGTATDEQIIDRIKARGKTAALWDGSTNGYQSPSEADLALCGSLAYYCGPDRERVERLFRQSDLMRPKWDRKDYAERTIAAAMNGRTDWYDWSANPDGPITPTTTAGDEQKIASTKLVELTIAAGAELFHTPGTDSEGYATIPISERQETWKLRSTAFRRWLSRQFWLFEGKAANFQSLQSAIGVLEGQAIYDGVEQEVSLRVAGYKGRIYLDLCNDDWQVIEIGKPGWRVANDPPVKFRRAKAMLPLLKPEKGGHVDELREFVNITDQQWPLLLGWLVAALQPIGPYSNLSLHGEQGSAKSTTARVLRSLVDPNKAALRAEPRDTRDLAIAAANGWIVALDNLSDLRSWLSDTLCRLSTGGGFATRTLYTDEDETIFDSMRPAILTGITEVASRGDLIERSLLIHLPAIPEEKRRAEREFWRSFEKARPRILGALLDAVVAGLRNLPTLHLLTLPRMADFAQWVTACEPALGLANGEFMKAYSLNQETANDTALEGTPISKYLRQMAEDDEWRGTFGELLIVLDRQATDGELKMRSWPKTARGLSGIVRRIAPNLRQAGIEVEIERNGHGTVVMLKEATKKNV